jgi:thiol:disulfide interchange protein
MFLRVIFGLAAGAVLGGFLGYFGKCSSGACPLTANPYRSAAFGALIGLLVTAGPSCNQSNYKGFIRGMEKVVTIESESAFSTSVLEGASIALVDFYADWCPHCRDLMPTIANLTERYEGV